jgi:hypothetical protein
VTARPHRYGPAGTRRPSRFRAACAVVRRGDATALWLVPGVMPVGASPPTGLTPICLPAAGGVPGAGVLARTAVHRVASLAGP